MPLPSSPTFIIDCPECKAKVAAAQSGIAEQGGIDHNDDPYGEKLYVGRCPICGLLLAGESHQIQFEGVDGPDDIWTDVVRVYPKATRVFTSRRIPNAVTTSLLEAERCLQVNANIAACAMLGRSLEAVCRGVLDSKQQASQIPALASEAVGEVAQKVPSVSKKKLMLGEGIKMLLTEGIIDQRLYDWSKQLNAFRNLAAHPDDTPILREDAEDLQTFVYAIVEYIYDLTDRYEEFKARLDERKLREERRRARHIPLQEQ